MDVAQIGWTMYIYVSILFDVFFVFIFLQYFLCSIAL